MTLRLSCCLIVASLLPHAAGGQSVVPAQPPARECPTAQPYCNNTWEAAGANGQRYWMARWAKGAPSDVVTLRFPLTIVDPVGRINCSAFSKDFPQPSCQQPFTVSLLLRASLNDILSLSKLTDVTHEAFDGMASILVTSPAGGVGWSNIEEIYSRGLRSFGRIGQRNYPDRSYHERRNDLSMSGVPRHVIGREAIGLRDIYYDGPSFEESQNVISCTYENSPVINRDCRQTFIIKSINSIANVSYNYSNIRLWKEINRTVNDAIQSSIYDN